MNHCVLLKIEKRKKKKHFELNEQGAFLGLRIIDL